LEKRDSASRFEASRCRNDGLVVVKGVVFSAPAARKANRRHRRPDRGLDPFLEFETRFGQNRWNLDRFGADCAEEAGTAVLLVEPQSEVALALAEAHKLADVGRRDAQRPPGQPIRRNESIEFRLR
jgi:hypothetical protein